MIEMLYATIGRPRPRAPQRIHLFWPRQQRPLCNRAVDRGAGLNYVAKSDVQESLICGPCAQVYKTYQSMTTGEPTEG